MLSRKTRALIGALSAVVLLAFVLRAFAAPAGPPIRIGGTLALTGPLAATALLVIGGLPLVRQLRDRRAATVPTCLVLHAVFVLFLFGNQFSWS